MSPSRDPVYLMMFVWYLALMFASAFQVPFCYYLYAAIAITYLHMYLSE